MDELDELVNLIPDDSVWEFVKFLCDQKGVTVDTKKNTRRMERVNQRIFKTKSALKKTLSHKCVPSHPLIKKSVYVDDTHKIFK